MSATPKLKVRRFPGNPGEEVLDFAEARELPFLEVFVFVEGQRVSTYEDFLQMVAQPAYRDKESLEVMVMASDLISGG